MTTETGGLFTGLEPIQTDSLLRLIQLAAEDDRPGKIDVGVGVYRTSNGATPILSAIKKAEKILWETQETKAYLGMSGDKKYAELLKPIVFGDDLAQMDGLIGLQTPGGCGALTLGFMLAKAANPATRVLVGTPTWANHPPVIRGAGLEIVEYDYYLKGETRIDFDAMMAAFDAARPGDVALLHGCCHNPTGADLDAGQWAKVRAKCAEKGIIPFVDIAYQGLGDGIDEDAEGLRGLVHACDEVIVAQSCDKNFGVYRDRVGCLFVKTGSEERAKVVNSHIMQIARTMWSMPPDHSAAAVRIILESDELRAEWLDELDMMRGRIVDLRKRIASSDPRLAYIADQKGMFSMMPLSPEQVEKLRIDHAIYMADSGRFNVCGMADEDVDRFCNAVLEAMDG
ncbi:aromatic amino acid transaminase [Sphingomicrobium sediminis]|uniref:Aromatic amino acid transaminase n=1 Tax=Sphingomicrobium sediminis TaxID=2950949 RepID=A0A9X2EI88_9SPHN|nr:aromatic amino acid transaminase [Sphingomicrobium sediminis]MCM8557236.1 aromatic amino acid transaminase [Sphingomicrobium sediminis]